MKTISAKNKFKKILTKRDPRQDPRRPVPTRLKPIKRKPSKKK